MSHEAGTITSTASEAHLVPTHSWTQTLSDITISVPLEKSTRARELEVIISNNNVSAKFRSSPSFLLQGELSQSIKPGDSTWHLDDGTTLVLELQKLKSQNWWKCLLKGDPEIDTSTIAPENSRLGDLDPETRAAVEKMMFDQQQKKMSEQKGEQVNKQEALENFMKAHPEMDFSQAKIQ